MYATFLTVHPRSSSLQTRVSYSPRWPRIVWRQSASFFPALLWYTAEGNLGTISRVLLESASCESDEKAHFFLATIWPSARWKIHQMLGRVRQGVGTCNVILDKAYIVWSISHQTLRLRWPYSRIRQFLGDIFQDLPIAWGIRTYRAASGQDRGSEYRISSSRLRGSGRCCDSMSVMTVSWLSSRYWIT